MTFRAAGQGGGLSLGATFVELGLESQEGSGGYAREQSEDFLAKQRELIGNEVAASDVVITTAAVPGRQAPILVTTQMVERMAEGSVIVDLGRRFRAATASCRNRARTSCITVWSWPGCPTPASAMPTTPASSIPATS